MPSPLSTVAMGRTNGSASAATKRRATCMMRTSTASPPPRNNRLLSVSPSTPSCTRAIAAPLMAQANSNSRSSRLRRRAGVRSFNLIDSVMVLRSDADPSSVVLFVDIVQPPDDVAGIREVVCGDGLFDLLPFERRQLVELDARDLVDAGELDRPDVLLDPLEDGDGVAVRTDEVPSLGPAVTGSQQRHQQRDDEGDGHQPGDAATAVTATVFRDEFLEVLVGFRFEVTVFVEGRLERVKEQRGQSQRLSGDRRLERQRFRCRADSLRRSAR